jgi:lipid-A-disaccharide synthase
MTGVLGKVVGALDARRPDAVVLVDYPVFNLSVARTAHRRGIPVYYFVAPQLWAWANWRVGRYARVVDEALVIFPFEVPFYEAAGLKTSYIGHPSLDGLPVEPPLLDEITARPCPVAVLPGSRRRELDNHLPIFMDVALRLQASHPDVSFHTAHIKDADREQTLAEAEKAGVEVISHGDRVHEVMASCRCAMISSGTATMETAMLGTPMAIFYSITPFEEFLRHTVSVTDYVGQVNLAAGKEVCPEILQTDTDPGRLHDAMEPLLTDTPTFRRQTEEIAAIRARISPGAVNRAADILANRLARS